MNTNLTSKQSIVLTLLEADNEKQVKTTAADQITRISIVSGMTKKAIDSQLRVLASKNLVTKVGTKWLAIINTNEPVVTIDPTDGPDILVSRELDGMTLEDRTEYLESAVDYDDLAKVNEEFAKIVADADKPARITAHTACDHDTSKAARAKCRRARRNAS